MNPFFSVIIPLYNKEHYICKTVESVLKQSFIDYELIIVNDGSTDNSLEVVSNILDNRIRLINKINGGVSSARNKGINIANGQYICFLDADDTWNINYLCEMHRLINKYPQEVCFAVALTGRLVKLPTVEYIIDNHCKYYYLFTSSSICVKKDVFNVVGYFREGIQLGEDRDMWLRIGCKYKMVYYNKELATYPRITENNLCYSIDISKSFPYWEWYNYNYPYKNSLYYYATRMLVVATEVLIKENRYREAFCFIKKTKGYSFLKTRTIILIRCLLLWIKS